MAPPIRRLFDISGCIALACGVVALAAAQWFEPEWLRVLLLRGLLVSLSLAVALFGIARVVEIAGALARWRRRPARLERPRRVDVRAPADPLPAARLKDERHIDDAA